MTLEETKRTIADIAALDAKKDWESAHMSEAVLLHRFVYTMARERITKESKKTAVLISDHLSFTHNNSVRYYSK